MSLPDRSTAYALRGLFFLALAVVLVLTLIPAPPPSGGNGDKVEHFAAFYLLTLLGAAAYRRGNLLWIALALSAYGALIEVLQGTAFIGRSRDILDWVADTAGILIALAPIMVAGWRNRAPNAHLGKNHP